MAKYRVTVPPTNEQGSYSCMASSSMVESHQQDALWQYNNARDHDGLPPIKRMPAGTEYTKEPRAKRYETIFVIQYKYKKMRWEDVSEYSSPDYENPRSSALEDLREYRMSRDGSYRLITRKVKLN